jgi:hypothetical protein
MAELDWSVLDEDDDVIEVKSPPPQAKRGYGSSAAHQSTLKLLQSISPGGTGEDPHPTAS